MLLCVRDPGRGRNRHQGTAGQQGDRLHRPTQLRSCLLYPVHQLYWQAAQGSPEFLFCVWVPRHGCHHHQITGKPGINNTLYTRHLHLPVGRLPSTLWTSVPHSEKNVDLAPSRDALQFAWLLHAVCFVILLMCLKPEMCQSIFLTMVLYVASSEGFKKFKTAAI